MESEDLKKMSQKRKQYFIFILGKNKSVKEMTVEKMLKAEETWPAEMEKIAVDICRNNVRS